MCINQCNEKTVSGRIWTNETHYIQDQYERDSPLYTTLETPVQPNYSLGPPYTNYSQPPYYNYRPHYTSDILNPPASSYTGFHRADSHHQPFAYDELSKLNAN